MLNDFSICKKKQKQSAVPRLGTETERSKVPGQPMPNVETLFQKDEVGIKINKIISNII